MGEEYEARTQSEWEWGEVRILIRAASCRLSATKKTLAIFKMM